MTLTEKAEGGGGVGYLVLRALVVLRCRQRSRRQTDCIGREICLMNRGMNRDMMGQGMYVWELRGGERNDNRCQMGRGSREGEAWIGWWHWIFIMRKVKKRRGEKDGDRLPTRLVTKVQT